MLETALIAGALVVAAIPPEHTGATSARIVVQHAPLAGFLYYSGKDVWNEMKPGDRLRLLREPANPHDPNAVRIEWNGLMLGYVPRKDNPDLARQMDYGAAVEARITALQPASNGRHRISYEIYVPLTARTR